jgi:hypothetical protein
MSDARVTVPDGDQELFELCDRNDEAQVLAELSGRVVDSYLYTFPGQEGKLVTGLSLSGVNWACREFAKHGEVIRMVSKPEIVLDPTDPEHVIVSVVAQRFAVNAETGRELALDSAIGVKRQWIKQALRDGSSKLDKFFVEKAVSKAQRNAKSALLPTDFVKKVIAQALAQQGKGVQPKAVAKAAPKAADPKTQPVQPQPAQAKAPDQKPVQAAPAAQPAPKPVQKAPTPAPVAPAASQAPPATPPNLKALHQRFWVVLKAATGLKDETAARAALKHLVGKDKVSETDPEILKKVGILLAECAKGNAGLVEVDGRLVIMAKDGTQAWPEEPAVIVDEAQQTVGEVAEQQGEYY